MTIKHWEKVQLREAATKVGSGATPTGGKEAYHTSGIPLIRSQNVRFEGFTEDGLVFLDASQAANLDNAVVCKNDILLNITGASIGRVTLAPPHMDGARVNQHVTIVRLKDHIDPSFVRWFIASPSQQRQINSIQVGVTRQALTKDMILRFELPLPPFGEQKRIVAKIEELFSDLDAGVAALNRAKANLKRYRACVLKAAAEGKLTEEWRARHPATEPASALLARILKERRQKWEADQLAKFAAADKEPPKNWREKYVEPTPPDTTGLPALPEGWCWATIHQLNSAERPISYGVLQPGSDLPEGIPLVRVCDIADGKVAAEQLKKISPSISEQFRRTILRGGEVLLTVVGTIGRTAVAPKALVGANTARAVAVIAVVPPCNSSFLEITLRESSMRAKLTKAAHEVARKTLNLEDLRVVVVPLPSLPEQQIILQEVVEKLSQIEAAEREIEHGLLRASRLRQSILKQAFEGRLVPQDPTDEPASVLLERLRASRSVHEGSGKPTASVRSRGRRAKSKQASPPGEEAER